MHSLTKRLTQLIDVACFLPLNDTVVPSETKHLHTQKTSLSIKDVFAMNRWWYGHSASACHVCMKLAVLSRSCQDTHLCPEFLLKQTRGSVIHFLHRSWHEHTEVYSHDPSKPSSGRGYRTHDTGIISPSYFLHLAVSLSVSVGRNKIKCGAVPGAFVLCCAPLVTSIRLTHKDKLLEQTHIMRRPLNNIGEGGPCIVSLLIRT